MQPPVQMPQPKDSEMTGEHLDMSYSLVTLTSDEPGLDANCLRARASVGWLNSVHLPTNTYLPAIATIYALAKSGHWLSRASCVGLCVANRLFLALATL